MSPLKRSVRNRAAAVTIIAAVGVGGASLAAAASPTSIPASLGSVSAQSQDESSATADDSSGTTSERASRTDRLTETLAPLVEDGTLTQEQAEKVVAALEEAQPSGGKRGGGGKGAGLDAAAEALGLTTDELREDLTSGESTLADIAQAEGVDSSTLIEALVADATDKIAERVADGSLTQEKADEMLPSLTERITTMVEEGTGERGGAGRGDHGGGERSGDDAPAESEADAGTT